MYTSVRPSYFLNPSGVLEEGLVVDTAGLIEIELLYVATSFGTSLNSLSSVPHATSVYYLPNPNKQGFGFRPTIQHFPSLWIDLSRILCPCKAEILEQTVAPHMFSPTLNVGCCGLEGKRAWLVGPNITECRFRYLEQKVV